MLGLVGDACFTHVAEAEASYVAGFPVPLPLPPTHPSGFLVSYGRKLIQSNETRPF